jgi:hypothetical protein
MKTLALFALMATLTTASLSADDKVGFKPNDTTASVLQRQAGQKVEIRLKSGDKIAGKIEAVGESTVHVSSLTGQEFYDAIVLLEDISAIVIRTDRR